MTLYRPVAALPWLLCLAACGGADAPSAADGPEIVPTYNRQTGRLEQLASDRNGDGRVDTWAYMDGRRLVRVETDRDGDGVPDRVEHYETPAAADPASPLGGAVLVAAEESGGADRSVTRREVYEGGLLIRVEEDLDGDGRIDKWEHHADGRLLRIELDLQQRGVPDRRLLYGPGGVTVEVDPDGDGRFEPAAPGDGRDAQGAESPR